MNTSRTGLLAFVTLATLFAQPVIAAGVDARDLVARMDTEYQAAVERNDWQTMDRILHPDFVLVLGNGKVISRAELIASARNKDVVYEKQVEVPGSQSVRLYGRNTATVSACLWIKYTDDKQVVHDYKVWFTDTYVLANDRWSYAFGQASLHMP